MCRQKRVCQNTPPQPFPEMYSNNIETRPTLPNIYRESLQNSPLLHTYRHGLRRSVLQRSIQNTILGAAVLPPPLDTTLTHHFWHNPIFVFESQGQPFSLSLGSMLRYYPPLSGQRQVYSSYGQSIGRAHCRPPRCPRPASPEHVVLFRGHPFSLAHWRTPRIALPQQPSDMSLHPIVVTFLSRPHWQKYHTSYGIYIYGKKRTVSTYGKTKK